MNAGNRARDGYERDPRDFYATPSWAVEELYRTLPNLPQATIDPCAGTGALLLAANARRRGRRGADARGIEQDHELAALAEEAGAAVTVGDGLALDWKGHHVIINPPYRDAATWIEKGVKEAATVCALLRLGFLASETRHEFWKANPPRALVVLSNRPSFTPDGRTDSSDYAWFIWANSAALSRGDGLVTLDWISRPAGAPRVNATEALKKQPTKPKRRGRPKGSASVKARRGQGAGGERD